MNKSKTVNQSSVAKAMDDKLIKGSIDEKIKEKVVNRTGKPDKIAKIELKAVEVEKKLDKTEIAKLNQKKIAEKSAEAKPVEDKPAEKPLDVARGKESPKAHHTMSIDLKAMLTVGCHMGHKQAKVHPKSAEFIYSYKDGVSVIDLPQTMSCLQLACDFLKQKRKEGAVIGLIGTKRTAKEVVRRVAGEQGLPYVTGRWLGGTISNWEQIKRVIKKLNTTKKAWEKGEYNAISKKDQSLIRRDITRMESMVGGLIDMEKLFDVLVMVDIGVERTAMLEAKGKGIPIVALTDTDVNPFLVDYCIPVNDDSPKSVALIVEELGKALSK